MSSPPNPEPSPERQHGPVSPELDDHRVDEDFDLDDLGTERSPSTEADGGSASSGPSTPIGSSLGKWVGAGLVLFVAAMIGLSTLGSPRPAGDETVHANWANHVQPVTQHNESGSTKTPAVRHIGSGGAVAYTTSVGVSRADVDSATTGAVRDAAASGDASAIEAAVVAAQQIPELTTVQQEIVAKKMRGPAPKPSVTRGMQDAIRSGDADFYHLYLFDSCDEDGDIVEVLLDGKPFALVPITHKGATLSVPIVAGSSTSVSLRGVHDGVGGITVACRTSLGDSFFSVMLEGQVQSIAVTP